MISISISISALIIGIIIIFIIGCGLHMYLSQNDPFNFAGIIGLVIIIAGILFGVGVFVGKYFL